MNRRTWSEVDHYFQEKLLTSDSFLDTVLTRNRQAGLPEIDVSATQGKLLHLLVKMSKPKRVLEIGTLGGYSTIWMGRGLPEDGNIVSLELSEHHAQTARQNIQEAELEHKVEILNGPALEILPTLEDKGYGPFDFIFIDADKPNNPHYLKWALKLAADGAVIIGDNVVRNGEVTDHRSNDERIHGVRQFIDLLNESEDIDSTAIQTVGSKGYDGFTLGVVQKKN
ncbi:O-methyltransferase [Alkalicoccobacillus porphyridii]|uniref:O-methyltransferase n=1 Tax=Alkalicoccobacillus porphyridii TaxID=2597270 RepID=A0A553ZZF8_9BACI|nr:O-methyltransferase [Alkalicoccobacillus porphyridii]TSB46815.1 O-methyltransferase [Alkalicoccobacillus porphyridii]